jgi:hypothetical protein
VEAALRAGNADTFEAPGAWLPPLDSGGGGAGIVVLGLFTAVSHFPLGNPWMPGFELPPVPGLFCSVCADAVDAISTIAAMLIFRG